MSARIARIYFIAVLLAYAVVFCVASGPPLLDDYPDWVYQGVIFARLIQHHPSTAYVLKHHPVPNSLTTVGIGLLCAAFGWKLAAKIWLVCVLAIFGAGCLRLEKRLKIPGSHALFLLPTAILVGFNFWLGYVGFLLGVALMLWMIAHLLDDKRHDWKTAIYLVLIFFAHFLPCAAAIVVLCMLSRQERSWRILAAAPVIVLIVWYAAVGDSGERVVHTSPLHLMPALLACGCILLPKRMSAIRNRVVALMGGTAVAIALIASPTYRRLLWKKVPEYVDGFGVANIARQGGEHTFLLPHALQNPAAAWLGILLSAIVAVLVFFSLREYLRPGSPQRFLAISVFAFLTAFLLLPSDSLGVIAIDDRVLTLGLCLTLFLVGTVSRPAKWTAVGLSVLIATLNLFQMAVLQNRAVPRFARWSSAPIPTGIALSDPMVRLYCYERLERGDYRGSIFTTGILDWNRP